MDGHYRKELEEVAQQISDKLTEVAPAMSGSDLAFVMIEALRGCRMSIDTDGNLKLNQCLIHLSYLCELLLNDTGSPP